MSSPPTVVALCGQFSFTSSVFSSPETTKGYNKIFLIQFQELFVFLLNPKSKVKSLSYPVCARSF